MGKVWSELTIRSMNYISPSYWFCRADRQSLHGSVRYLLSNWSVHWHVYYIRIYTWIFQICNIFETLHTWKIYIFFHIWYIYIDIIYVYIYIKHQYTKAYMFIRNPIPVDKHKSLYKQKWWSSSADIFAGFLNHQRPWKKKCEGAGVLLHCWSRRWLSTHQPLGWPEYWDDLSWVWMARFFRPW